MPTRPLTALSFVLLSSACAEYTLSDLREDAPAELTSYAAALKVEPEAIDFEPLALGASASEVITLTNIGDGDLWLEPLDLDGPIAFSVTGLETPVLAPGASTEVWVTFAPINYDDPSATLEVRADTAHGIVDVPITGDLALPELEVTPGYTDLGVAAIGEELRSEVTVANVGASPLTILALDYYTDAPDLFLGAGVELVGQTLEPGEARAVEVIFAPDEAGAVEGTLTVTSDAPLDPMGAATQIAYAEPEDPCLDLETGYTLTPGAELVVLDDETTVEVTYTGSSAGYTNVLWLETPEVLHLATGHETQAGASTTLGPYVEGEVLSFSIYVRNTDDTYYSGDPADNPDGQNHVAITYQGECTWSVGFEDTYGGGDQDFNDITLTITGALTIE